MKRIKGKAQRRDALQCQATAEASDAAGQILLFARRGMNAQRAIDQLVVDELAEQKTEGSAAMNQVDQAESTPVVQVPRELFLSLVWLQSHYANLLNMHDGGARQSVELPIYLTKVLTQRELDVRARALLKGAQQA